MVRPRITASTQSLMCLMVRDPGARFYGVELTKATGIKSGTLYPLLARLEREGWVTSAWEDIDPSAVGRPARRYYELTADGAAEAAEIRAGLRRMVGARPRLAT